MYYYISIYLIGNDTYGTGDLIAENTSHSLSKVDCGVFLHLEIALWDGCFDNTRISFVLLFVPLGEYCS